MNDHTAHALLERWTPDDLTAIYAEVAPSVTAQLAPHDVPGWFDELSGRADALASPIRSLEEIVHKGTLAAHLRDALTATRYGGAMPGSVPAPARFVSAFTPVQLSNDSMSVHLLKLQPVNHGDDPERDAHIAEYQRSVALLPEFTALVADIALEVLADRERAWQAFLHLRALDAARREHERREAAAEHERQRLAAEQCPVCLAHDPRHIGSIAVRALLPAIEIVREGVAAIRSCAACWSIASAAHVQRLVGEPVDGNKRLTRGDAVARALDTESR